jgi:MFS family permease
MIPSTYLDSSQIVTTILTSVYAHDGDAGRMDLIYSCRQSIHEITNRRRRRQLILGPFVLAKTMLWDPIRMLDRQTIFAAYTIDVGSHHDFFVVTISRLCYYCGSSVQTFFLYFLHDIIQVRDNTETAVAGLAVVSQISGALFCYPVGYISDRFCGGRRKPFVYAACGLLGAVTFSMTFARTMNEMSLLCFILGAANGSYLTMETSLAVDTMPEDYEDGPSGGHAQLLGVWGVAAFMGSALGPMVGGPLLYLVGSYGTVVEKQEYSVYGYAVVLSLATFYFLLSAVSLRWVRKADV